MKNNNIYIVIIVGLIAIIVFLVILLFIGDSGKYCEPTIKEQIDFSKRNLNTDSLIRKDSSRKNNY
jgi:hypothetical protein